MNRRVIIFTASLSAVSVLLAFALHLLRPVEVGAKALPFVVERGIGVSGIVEALAGAGMIRSPFAFKAYTALAGVGNKLKAGSYRFSPAMSIPEIIGMLVEGPETDVPVLIVEGATIVDVDAALAAAGVLEEGELREFAWQGLVGDFPFLKGARSLEGFLFPDTYRFFPGSPPEEIVRRMLANFEKKALSIMDQNHSRFTDYQIIIIASLIEKEVPFHNDRRIVSGIIRNRLAISMPLQIDAAPITYERYGLPAAPIANVSADAIRAALNPIVTGYLYYLSDPKTHKTIFAETLDEHNDNRWRYLRK